MDEPSTGLDPASRNNLWNVVKRAKQNRAIILTSTLSSLTHFCTSTFHFLKFCQFVKDLLTYGPSKSAQFFFNILTSIMCCFASPDNYPLDSTFNGRGGASL